MLKKKFKTTLSIIFSVAILLNNLYAPATIFAQELAEPTPEVVVVPEPTPTVEAQVVEVTEVTPTPEEPTPAQVEEPLPTELPTETPAPELVEPNPTLEIQTSGIVESQAATESAIILQEDLEVTETQSSATLVPSLGTDKADYAPDEQVVITGADYPVNTELNVRIIWPDSAVRSSDGTEDVTDTTITDESGNLLFIYDLRGFGQEGEYLVEILLSSTVLATTTFTDSHILSHECVVDTADADDEPGQKDLTQMCVDYSGLNTYIEVDWNWDEIRWTGQNTGDGCALFDNDGDGFANYASCVTVTGNPATQASESPRLYSCNDTRVDRCAGSTLITGPYSTSCSVGQFDDQPFAIGDETPTDTKASCNIILSEVGGEIDTILIDVCSYPSQQPNSDPSDCIVFQSRAGRLEVVKNLIPDTDNGLFNLLIDGQSYATDAGHGGTTGEQVFDVSNNGTTFTVSEQAGTGTSLTNYSTSIECIDLNGTGSIVAQSSTNTVDVLLNDGDDIVCTINNSIATGTVTVIKDVIPDDASTWNFDLTWGGFLQSTPSLIGDGGQYMFADISAGTYLLRESPTNSDYKTTASCVSGEQGTTEVQFDLSPGEDVVCTFVNSRLPKLTLVKNVVNDNGGVATANQWTLQASGTGGFSGSGPTVGPNQVLPGESYLLSEFGGPAGYSEGTWSCNGGVQLRSEITLAYGDDVTCAISNDDIAPTLTLTKTVINDNGGLLGEGDFIPRIDGIRVSWDSAETLIVGDHTASEDAVFGYIPSDWGGDCATDGSVYLNPGDNKTCSISNDDTAPKLKLIKYVTNDDGGTKQVSDFNLYIGGNPATSGVFYDVDANIELTVSEDQVSGYTPTSWGGDCSADGKITLLPGESKTCTITNDDNAPTLKLVKSVTNDNGGTSQSSAWDLTARRLCFAGDTDPTCGFTDQGDSTTFHTVLAGRPYNLTESGPSGYTMGSWSCAGGGTQNGSRITLGLDDDVTCTITNDDNAPTLKLVKSVTNDNGGTSQSSAWDLTARRLCFAGDTDPTCGFTDQGDSTTFHTVLAGRPYNLTESGPSGYTMGSWSCAGGGTQNGSRITLGLDDDVTCTITNDDNAPTLKLVKSVTNDNGGTSQSSAWDLTARRLCFAGDTDPTCGFTDQGDSTTFHTVLAGRPYNLTESGPSGYTMGSWSCAGGGTQNGSRITLGLDDDVTCTITNDDNAPTLKLVKSVTNDNGGTSQSSAWDLTARRLCFAGDTDPTCGFTDQGDSTTFHTVLAGRPYNLTESGPSGYTMGSWSCAGGGTQNGNKITLGLDDDVTCTITNDDNAPTLKLVKSVTNDNGGTSQSSAWDLTARRLCFAGDTDPTCGFTDQGDSTTFHTVLAGRPYNLTESGPSGYTMGSWSCAGGGTQNGNKITLGLDDDVTCTITNDDNAPTLKLVKSVTNDNGGTSQSSAWDLTARRLCFAGDTDPTCGFTDQGDSTTFHTVLAGRPYNLTESGPSGYTMGSWSCAGGGTQNGNKITLGLDDDVTCTITNDDNAPTLKLVKSVTNDNGGTSQSSAWDLTARRLCFAGDTDPTCGFTDQGDSTTFHTVLAGRPYNLTESGPSGYTMGSWSCAGGGTQNGNKITLGLDDDVTCTITNDDQPGEISGKKFNDLDGSHTYHDATTDPNLSGWTIKLDLVGTSAPPACSGGTINGEFCEVFTNSSGSYNFNALAAGDYIVSEVLQAGWLQTRPDATYGGQGHQADGTYHLTLANGETIGSRLFGNQARGTIKVQKDVVPNDSSLWNFSLTSNLGYSDTALLGDGGEKQFQDGNGTGDLPAAQYTIAELTSINYTTKVNCGAKTSNQWLDTSQVIFNLEANQEVVCVFENSAKPGDISGYKIEDKNADAQYHANVGDVYGAGWTIELYEGINLVATTTTDSNGYYEFTNVPSGKTYSVCEVIPTGWYQTSPGDEQNPDCHDIVMGPNGSYPNNDYYNAQYASIGDFIWEDLNADGVQDGGEPALGGVVVYLYLDDGDGVFEQGTDDTLVGTEISDNTTGLYLFENLPVGSYWIWVDALTAPIGYILTTTSLVGPVDLLGNDIYLDADYGFISPTIDIEIEKTNDKTGGAARNDTVNYTLRVRNTGQVLIFDTEVLDVLPGGFEYVAGSTKIDGAPSSDPTQSGGVLRWNVGVVNPNQEIVVEYQATINENVVDATYTNYATCRGYIGRFLRQVTFTRVLSDELEIEAETINCNVVTSDVSVGSTLTYSDGIQPQVLGASTILPATGSDTKIIMSLAYLIFIGLVLKIVGYRLRREN